MVPGKKQETRSGIVSAKDLMTMDDDLTMDELMEKEIISVTTHTDQGGGGAPVVTIQSFVPAGAGSAGIYGWNRDDR